MSWKNIKEPSVFNSELEGDITMGRAHQVTRDKNKASLPQTPSYEIASDGLDLEFSEEMADHDDLVALQRSKEADARVKNKKR